MNEGQGAGESAAARSDRSTTSSADPAATAPAPTATLAIPACDDAPAASAPQEGARQSSAPSTPSTSAAADSVRSWILEISQKAGAIDAAPAPAATDEHARPASLAPTGITCGDSMRSKSLEDLVAELACCLADNAHDADFLDEVGGAIGEALGGHAVCAYLLLCCIAHLPPPSPHGVRQRAPANIKWAQISGSGNALDKPEEGDAAPSGTTLGICLEGIFPLWLRRQLRSGRSFPGAPGCTLLLT